MRGFLSPSGCRDLPPKWPSTPTFTPTPETRGGIRWTNGAVLPGWHNTFQSELRYLHYTSWGVPVPVRQRFRYLSDTCWRSVLWRRRLPVSCRRSLWLSHCGGVAGAARGHHASPVDAIGVQEQRDILGLTLDGHCEPGLAAAADVGDLAVDLPQGGGDSIRGLFRTECLRMRLATPPGAASLMKPVSSLFETSTVRGQLSLLIPVQSRTRGSGLDGISS